MIGISTYIHLKRRLPLSNLFLLVLVVLQQYHVTTTAFYVSSFHGANRICDSSTTNKVASLSLSPVGISQEKSQDVNEIQLNKINNNNNDLPVPFIIERLPSRPNPKVFQDISQMCITAFFNDNPSSISNDNNSLLRTPVFFKEYQLGVLRSLQQNDLKLRRRSEGDRNIMFVAYQVVPVSTKLSSKISKTTPLILNLDNVYNKESLRQITKSKSKTTMHQQRNNRDDNSQQSSTSAVNEFLNNNNVCDYVRGDVLGFVEVTQRQYGLGDFVLDEDNNEQQQQNGGVENSSFENRRQPTGDTASIGTRRKVSPYKLRNSNFKDTTISRPLLTNLSVKKDVRKSGVGSALLDECEKAVVASWNMKEMILEVESDNTRAIDFYKNRNYRILYEDPASRRYDVNGLWLQQVRCKRYIFRKSLSLNLPSIIAPEMSSTLSKGIDALKRFVSIRSSTTTR